MVSECVQRSGCRIAAWIYRLNILSAWDDEMGNDSSMVSVICSNIRSENPEPGNLGLKAFADLGLWDRGPWIRKGESFGGSMVLVRVCCSCEKLGVSITLISSLIHGWIQDTQLLWFQSLLESWNHTQKIFLSLEGRFLFYRKHPAVIQKYGIWAECHLFIKTQKSLGPLVAFLELSDTAGAQLFTRNSRNWSAAMATGNTESGLANQWLKMHVWKSYFIVSNCFICWHTNASIQITFFVSLQLGFMWV